MKLFKYQTKRKKYQMKSDKAFWSGRSIIKKYWDKKIHKLDEKFYGSK